MSFITKNKPQKSSLTLKDYQKLAIRNLLRKPKHGLFLPTGLGKTVVILKTFEELLKKKTVGSMLVVSTIRVCYNVWPREIEKWGFNYSYTILHGKGKKNLDTNFDIYLINYEGLPWFYKQIQEDPGLCPDMLVLDESTKIKHSSSARFKLLKNMRILFNRITPMTGTPNPNGYMDLWSQIYMIDGGKALGEYVTHYRTKYFHKIRMENFVMYSIHKGAREKIQRKIKPLVTHIPRDVVKLPPLTQNIVPVMLPEEAMGLYTKMEKKMVIEINKKKITAVNAGVVTGKCRQLANGIVFTGEGRNVELVHDEKIKALKDVLEESGEPTIVGYEFVPDGDRIEKELGKYKLARIGGGDTGLRALSKWDSGKLDVLLVQTSAVAHGLNLQVGGRQLIFYGLTWNLEVYQQLIDRIHRQGQKKPVLIFHILAVGTIDFVMEKVLERKAITQQQFLNAIVDRQYR